VPLLFALGQRVIVSSVALLTSLILFNRQTLVQSRLLPATLSAVTLSMALVQMQSGGVAFLCCPLAGLLALFPVLLPLLLSPLLLLRSLPTDAKPSIEEAMLGTVDSNIELGRTHLLRFF